LVEACATLDLIIPGSNGFTDKVGAGEFFVGRENSGDKLSKVKFYTGKFPKRIILSF